MSNPTKTRLARDLYDELRKQGLVHIMFEGLMGDAVWISSGRRAYRLKDLSDMHLMNIKQKYWKKSQLVPECIMNEWERREEARLASKC